MTAQEKFRAGHRRRLNTALSVALVLVLFLLGFAPPLSLPRYVPPRADMQLIPLPDEIRLPDPPQSVPRPKIPVAAIDDAEPEEEMAPTRFDPQDAALPPPPRSGPRFTVFDRMPEPRRVVPPEYPAMARRAGLEGTVRCLVTIGANGRVLDVKVLSSDAAVFDAPTVEAIRQWVFRPAEQSGIPVRATIVVPYRFTLRG